MYYVYKLFIFLKDIKFFVNQGFFFLFEDDIKLIFYRFDNQLNSSVKDFGDVYENEEYMLDIFID